MVFFWYFIIWITEGGAVWLKRRCNTCDERGRIAVEVTLHSVQRVFDHAADRSTPSGVDICDDAAIRVCDQDALAIGDFYEEGDARLRPVLQEGQAVRLHSRKECDIALQTGCLTRAVLQAPVLLNEAVCGLVSVDRRAAAQPFDEHEEKLLRLVAGHVSLALERAHRESVT